MGASFQTMQVPATKSQDEVQAIFAEAQKQDRYENGHEYSGGFGMVPGLKFARCTFVELKAAREWLITNCEKWEDAKAVHVKNTDLSKDGTWLIGAWCAE